MSVLIHFILIMYFANLFNYYRVGRFAFALALLISFQIAGFPEDVPSLIYVLAIYSIIAFIMFIGRSSTMGYADFLLDIIFISAMVFLASGTYSFLSLLYLFPLFFSTFLVKTKKIYLFPIMSVVLYSLALYLSGVAPGRESVLNVSLHLFSFSVIAFAGYGLKERLEDQERHIRRLEEERIRTKGFERLYRVSADLAHELRNPLASMSAAVQFMKEGRRDPDLIDMLTEETSRLTNLVNDFLSFARPAEAPKEEVELSELVRSILSHQENQKQVVSDIGDNALVTANRTFLEVALNNVIKNAFEAAKGMVKISLRKNPSLPMMPESTRKKGRTRGVTLEIEDDGDGIGEEMRDKIFEPFFTTKASGTGLGLAIAYRIITGYGGSIVVGRSSLGGARFRVVLPTQSTE